jgi:hypothetical protein
MGKCLHNINMEYKLQPVHLEVETLEEVDFPPVKERIIEKRGDVVEFSMKDLEDNITALQKLKRELEAKKDYDQMVVENIEQHHKFVKKMSEQDLLTAWMYKQHKGYVTVSEDKLKQVNKQLDSDLAEKEEIEKQIPELATVKSADIIDGEIKMVNE